MSKIRQSVASDGEQPQPGLEPWLVVCLLAFVPGALIVFLPRATLAPLLVPICGTMVALLLVGLVMLARVEWRHRRTGARASSDARTADGLEFQ
jgi:undecaprenyl pyrophosphate phosphatase UppP